MDPVSFGQYTVIRRLGSGGMADVYLARDPSLGREVAVKSPNLEIAGDDILNRFVVEAKAIAQLEHPAIVPLYEYGRQDGRPYLVMRYMRGGSLADRIAQRPLSLPEAATIVDRVGDALDYAHAHGILHRDVKPGNILFDDRGAAYLSDFGIARMIGGGDDMTVYKLTRTGFIVGTFEYISPEQVIGRTNLDGRSDLYSLGVVIYEMLTGKLPYHDSSPHLLAAQHVRDPIPLIRSARPDLPQTADQFIHYALAKEPEGRYQTGATLAIGLRSVAPPIPATPQARPIPEPKAKPAPNPKPEPKPKPPPKPRPAPKPNPLPKLWADFRQRAGSLLKRPTGRPTPGLADLVAIIFLSLAILLGIVGLFLFARIVVN